MFKAKVIHLNLFVSLILCKSLSLSVQSASTLTVLLENFGRSLPDLCIEILDLEFIRQNFSSGTFRH